ncbi:MAG: IS21 family transposase [Solirubrobacterales bacterium]
MELFEQIRRDKDVEDLSIRALAERHGVHRRTVRQALESAVPPPRKTPEGRPAPALGAFHKIVDGWLRADLEAPRKQRHTARRVWQRLVAEHGAQVSERQVRRYVRERRREFGEIEAFVPQAHPPGQTAEVDWGQAEIMLAGARSQVNFFVLRLSHSGAGLVQAFGHATQQAFLEGHVEAFAFLGGVPQRVRYDNLSSAVKLTLKGRQRVLADRFVALRSHYLFESQFTLVGLQGAHEKGGVENEVGRFRRRHLVPVPQVATLAELNAQLRAACIEDLGRRIVGRAETVGEALERERPLLRALPAEPFAVDEPGEARVDAKGLVTIRQNRYSVPIGLAGRRVVTQVGARWVTIVADGREVARHERLTGRFQTAARLEHYTPLLARKPGALAGSLPLAQARDQGAWPDEFDALWRALDERHGPSQAARQMVDLLAIVDEVGAGRVALACRGALAAGAVDARAVAVLARRAERPAPEPLTGLDARLAALARPAPALDDYDRLLEGGR